jgi:hypothetical protein
MPDERVARVKEAGLHQTPEQQAEREEIEDGLLRLIAS